MVTRKNVQATWEWIRQDWRTNPLRFAVEVAAWAISIGCSLWMAATVPTPPLIWIYPWFIAGCVMYAWAGGFLQDFDIECEAKGKNLARDGFAQQVLDQ